MWTLKIVVVLVSLWGERLTIEVNLPNAFHSWTACEAARPWHELILAYAIAGGSIAVPVDPLGRVITNGTCTQTLPFPFARGIPV